MELNQNNFYVMNYGDTAAPEQWMDFWPTKLHHIPVAVFVYTKRTHHIYVKKILIQL
jgi:hypothetical protein